MFTFLKYCIFNTDILTSIYHIFVLAFARPDTLELTINQYLRTTYKYLYSGMFIYIYLPVLECLYLKYISKSNSMFVCSYTGMSKCFYLPVAVC